MSMFGLGKPLEEQSPARRQVTQGVLVGGGFAGAGTVIFGTFEMVHSQPDKAFALLERWGPWFFLALFVVWAINGLMNRGIDVAERLGDRFASSMDRIADEQEKLASSSRDIADAAQRASATEDRERERMATMVDYSGQQSREAAEGVRSLHEKLDQLLQVQANKGG